MKDATRIQQWADVVRQRDGESNEDYWRRQQEFTESEARYINAWCDGARAMLGESPR